MNRSPNRARGFTLAEILTVIGVIAVIIAVLFPALIRAGRTARKTESMNRLRQIHMWMQGYSSSNNDYILPSQFDYSDSSVYTYQGKVRTVPANQPGMNLSVGAAHIGTWTDIVWTENSLYDGASGLLTVENTDNVAYRNDSPDERAYRMLDSDLPNPLRSAGHNTRNFEFNNTDDTFKPFGDGARERYLPGYFAANDFFNARPDAPPAPGSASTPAIGNWFTNGQIKVPERSMYLVDSCAGEVIAPMPEPYDHPDYDADGANVIVDLASRTDEVDFRYSESCLMLLLDGHIDNPGPWSDLNHLQGELRFNISNPLSSTP